MRYKALKSSVPTVIGIAIFVPYSALSSPILFPKNVIAQSHQLNLEVVNRHYQLGIQNYQAKEIEESILHLEKALEGYRLLKNRQGQSNALTMLGTAYLSQEEYYQAIKILNEFLPIAYDLRSQGEAFSNLGRAYNALGQYGLAIQATQKALIVMDQLKDLKGQGRVLINLGNIYESLGNYSLAKKAYGKSLKIAEEVNDNDVEQKILVNLGLIETNLNNHSQALEYLNQGLLMLENDNKSAEKSSILINIGNIYHKQENYNQAYFFYDKSRAISEKNSHYNIQFSALGSLALVSSKIEDTQKALQYYNQALAIAEKTNSPLLKARLLNNFSHTLFNARKLSAAESNLNNAIQILDDLRTNLDDISLVSLFDTQVFTYNLLQQVLVAQERKKDALVMSEHGRARAFMTTLSQQLATIDYPPNLEEIYHIAKTRQATLVEYSIIPDDNFIHQGRLQGKASQLYIWVIQSSGKIYFHQENLTTQDISLNQLIKNTRKSMDLSGRGTVTVRPRHAGRQAQQTQNLQKLHQILIKPIEKFLPKDPQEQVIFIPHRDLFLVPFPALLDKQENYLVTKHTILTSPAIQVLDFTRQQQKNIASSPAQNVVVVGNPTMPESLDLQPLLQAEEEAKEIAQLFASQSLLFLNEKATETAIKTQLSDAKIIHLATHGLLDTDEISISTDNADITDRDIAENIALKTQLKNGAIALASSDQDDGLLTYEEIFDLDLQAELVVLSACDTGRGEITGDGVIGLSRSFIAAGAPSVIVSLWSVPDAETAFLMTEFYRNLQEKKLDKAQSLREAMLTAIKKHPDPRNWAAFTLIGGRGINSKF